MRDCKRIRRHLWLALALPLAAPACVRDGAGAGGTGDAPRAAVVDAADRADATLTPPDAAVAVAVPDDPGLGHMPSCPSGAYCTTAKATRKIAEKGAGEQNGCAVRTSGLPRPLPENPPPMADIYSNYDDAATQLARADKSKADACCYTWVMPCPGGRPLSDDDAARVAPAREGDDWAHGAAFTGEVAPLSAALRTRVAEAWLADALAEHASVASFARATLELMAVGAPPDLLVAHQRAGLDEIVHAERCFALAARYAGLNREPGPLPAPMPRAGGLPRLARDTFLEGCVGETIASLAVARALVGCKDADVAAVLRGIGVDEERHAALAWRTIKWALAAGGAPVAEALRGAWQEARAALVTPFEPDDDETSSRLAAHGRLDHAAERRVRADALEAIVGPTIHALLG